MVKYVYTFNCNKLYRTCFSILRNTPSYLLGEIILIDDSCPIQLNATFLKYVDPKIRFRRNANRVGVIASRTLGATLIARHKYVFFMDSHCEVNVGWLEPLVERMMHNPGMVVSPTLDTIDAHTFEYDGDNRTFDRLRAGFDLSLRPRWFSVANESIEDGDGWNETRSYA